MIKPEKPENETTRLARLRALKILDTAAEERFDRLTRLAKRLFDVPIALISLVDQQRQWFKSKQGLDACETHRDISFCGHTILDDELFVIHDASKDERFHDNPLVAGDPNIRFYAGCPLQVDGLNLGTLCLIDDKPRDFSDADKAILRDVATMVEQELAALQQSTLDDLTRISNRRGFALLAQHTLALCQRMGKEITLLLLFLDEVKLEYINNEFGYIACERAVEDFAQVMGQVFRESDVFARIGGTEFAVLLSDINEGQTQHLVERFERALKLYNRECHRSYDLTFGSSTVSRVPDDNDAIDDLLALADKMFSDRKRSKNQASSDPS